MSLAGLRPGEVLLNADAADELGARAGDRLRIHYGVDAWNVHVKSIIGYPGAATDGSALLMPLAAAQSILGWPGSINAIFVANAGGVDQTDRMIARLKPTLDPLGLEADNTKQDALEAADTAGAAFISLFTTFGSFSIAAGILLIFLIFVMLAAERRGELGIARALGTRRGHLVQMFLYEGAAYDVLAALVGALIGVAVAYGMVIALASAFSATSDLKIAYEVEPASVAVAYAIGVLLTFGVVAFSAWRVSRMNIVSAIRNLPEPPHARIRGRLRLVVWFVGIALGALLVYGGASDMNAVMLGLGVSLVILSLVPLARLAGVSDRISHTAAGVLLVLWFVLPTDRWLFTETMKQNFSIFVLGGLTIVIGSTWVIVYNADVLLGALGSTFGRVKSAAPVLRMAMAYPLRARFRTGVTLAMFTLVVFTLGVGAMTTGSFVHAIDDVQSFGGGFDVRASTSSASPILDMNGALGRSGLDRRDFRLVSSQSTLPVEARQVGVRSAEESYLVHGVDATFLGHTTYALAARASGYTSDAAVWRALREHRNLAVVDQFSVQRKVRFGVPRQKFELRGFYLEDVTFAPVRIHVRDAQSGNSLTLTVVGVLSDTSPEFMRGIWTSQMTLNTAFRNRVLPTTHLFTLRSGADPNSAAASLESAFFANGMQADTVRELLDDAVGASLTFDRLIMGFMGLGLVVGVAALGVITARAVVERRQQIGVLRAIGFSRGMVQASFLLESSFIALTSIVIGTGLALAVAHNVIESSRETPSWSHMAFVVPWGTLGVIFLAVYLIALATTLAPAVRASRIYPAEALRYE